jgi:hypothetical protein
MDEELLFMAWVLLRVVTCRDDPGDGGLIRERRQRVHIVPSATVHRSVSCRSHAIFCGATTLPGMQTVVTAIHA